MSRRLNEGSLRSSRSSGYLQRCFSLKFLSEFAEQLIGQIGQRAGLPNDVGRCGNRRDCQIQQHDSTSPCVSNGADPPGAGCAPAPAELALSDRAADTVGGSGDGGLAGNASSAGHQLCGCAIAPLYSRTSGQRRAVVPGPTSSTSQCRDFLRDGYQLPQESVVPHTGLGTGAHVAHKLDQQADGSELNAVIGSPIDALPLVRTNLRATIARAMSFKTVSKSA